MLALKPLRRADRKRTCELQAGNQTWVPVQVNLQRARLRTALNEQKTLFVKDFSGFFVRSTVSSSLRTCGIGLCNSAANDFIYSLLMLL